MPPHIAQGVVFMVTVTAIVKTKSAGRAARRGGCWNGNAKPVASEVPGP